MNPSELARLAALTQEQLESVLSGLTPAERYQVLQELQVWADQPARRWYCPRNECDGLPHAGFHWCYHPIDSEDHEPFCKHARTSQRPPEGSWTVWLFSGGRGTGKTRAGAEWVLDLVWNQGYRRIALVGRTPGDVRDVMVGGDSGILNCSAPNERPKYEPSKRRLTWPNGAEAFAYSAATPGSLRGPQFEAAWCVAKDEPVMTARGEIPIQEVTVGDLVMTRDGWRYVSMSRMTNPDAEIMEIETVDGRVLRCTPNHRVWVNGDWMLAENVALGDGVMAWNSFTDPLLGLNGMAASGDEPKTATTRTSREASCISLCGKTSTDDGSTWANAGSRSSRVLRRWAHRLWGLVGVRSRLFADNADATTNQSVCGQGFVLVNVATSTSVSSVRRNGQRGEVYDLTVEGAHEFFASGLLVHNCDESAAWDDAIKGDTLDTAWNNLMLGLRHGKNPKCLVTTTPKRILLFKQVMDRKTTAMTNGTTWDNVDNLAPSFKETVLGAYDGTRIAEQELMGIYMEDVDGAMWNADMIEPNRASMLMAA